MGSLYLLAISISVGSVSRHIITAPVSQEAAKGSEWSQGTFVKMVPEAQLAMVSCKIVYGYETFQ